MKSDMGPSTSTDIKYPMSARNNSLKICNLPKALKDNDLTIAGEYMLKRCLNLESLLFLCGMLLTILAISPFFKGLITFNKKIND